MSAFEFYLRTGRRIASMAVGLETKFNPWHDPDDGRFTFAGQGRYFPGPGRSRNTRSNGFRSGGGSFGGGGASGSWGSNPRTESRIRGRGGSGGEGGATGSSRSPPVNQPSPVSQPPSATSIAAPPRQGNQASRERRLTVRKSGYEFSIDAHARTRLVSGEIRLQPESRSRRSQANAGIPDRRDSDDGGHFIAARFNGPREWFNHFAQDANFNRGVYRSIEDEWAKAVRAGRRVFVEIVPHYRGVSMRPHRLDIVWFIDGERFYRGLPNDKQGR